jgi:hypothetical protein
VSIIFRWCLAVILKLTRVAYRNTLPTSGIGAFGNLIIRDGFGFDVLQTSLLSIVQGTVHVLIVTFVAYVARRTKQTLYIMMA